MARNTPSNDVITRGKFTARRIGDDLRWGVGTIQPQAAFASDERQRELVQVVLENIEEVAAAEKPYSSCTDGRVPVKLLSGEPVPVREQLVGTDTMTFFHMAEALGPRFYKDPTAPLARRIQEVVAFMHDNGLKPSTHVACGAAAGYVPINQNLVDFAANPLFAARQQSLLPEGVYDETVRRELIAGYQDRLQRGMYDEWSDTMIMDAVRRVSGEYAIAELQDDGRGVHGHVEEQIVRIKVDGVAINEAKVTAVTNGREVFGENDTRMERNARLIAQGDDDAYRIALMAAEDFTDGGHGTLAKNLPTYVVTAA